MKRILFFLLVLVSSFSNIHYVSANTRIKNITIVGNKKYNSDYYMNLINLKTGDVYSDNKCNDAIKNIFSCGCLDDIKTYFDQSNGTLTFKIKEKPAIRRIEFIGAKEFEKDDEAKEKLKTKIKEIISSKFLTDDIEHIKNFYKAQGYFKVSVKTEIKDLGNGSIDLTFKVNDGGKAKINKIYFVGNKTFSNNTLKREIMSRENRFYRFGRTIRYDTFLVDYDTNLLLQFYNSKGYYAANIPTPVGIYNQKKNTFDIIFTIEENEKYLFGKIEIEDELKKIDKKLLEKAISEIKSGDVFNSKLVQNVMEDLNNIYEEKGYSFINITPKITKGDNENDINIKFIISENKKEYIGRIFIKNNSKTNDDVIREKLAINEGNVYNSFSIRKSVQMLESTGYFQKVTYEEEDGIFDNQKDLTIIVEEGDTGSLGASIGFSTLDGLVATGNYSERNLLGTGSELDFNISVSGNSKDAISIRTSINYAKPNIFGTKIFGGLGVSVQNNNNIENRSFEIGFDDITSSINAFINYYITDNLSQRISYNFEYKKLKKVDNEVINIMPKGDRYTSEISTGLTYDKIDNRYNPSKGYLLNTEVSYAGLFGNVDYIKTISYATFYKPIYLDKIIFKIEGKAGYITSINNNPLYPNDGFYLGGYNMRGFEFAGVGPRVKIGNKYSNGLSGTKMWYLNAEVKFPIFAPKDYGIYGILFINAASTTGIEKNKNVYGAQIEDSGSLRSSCGLSILFKIKMLGNMSFDFSKTLKKEPYDVDQFFRFNIGTRF